MKSIRLIALLLATAAVPAQGPGSEWVFLDGPPHTLGVGVVRQSNGRHFVAGPRGTVFETEGGRWLQRPTTGGPSDRLLPSYCYDSSRDLVYFFGGRNELQYKDDLWTWDGSKWTNVTPATGPAPRWGGLMAYDIVRDRVVLYGGSQSAGFSDTWEFDGTTWHATAPTVLPPSRGNAMSYDLVRQQCVLITHPGISGTPGSTYTWDGSDWTLVDTNGPATGQASAMAYDPARDTTVLVGGNPVSDQLWEWNGSSWTQITTLGSAARSRPSLSYDPHLGGVRMFGGQPITQGTFGTLHLSPQADAWLWNGATLQQVHGNLRPPNRHSSTFIADPFQDELLVFGGSLGLTVYDDTWTFDGDRWSQHTPAIAPAPRRAAAAVADPTTGTVLLFGGASASGAALNDLWSWDGNMWTEIAQAGPWPAARSAASMAFDPVTGGVMMFGGFGSSYLNDHWLWDGAAWTQLPSSGPPMRKGAAFAHDPIAGGMLMFGGDDGPTLGHVKTDLWRYTNGAWQQILTPTQPTPLAYPELLYEPTLNTMVLVGTHPAAGTEQWTFDGSNWSLLHSDQTAESRGQIAMRNADSRTYAYDGATLKVFTATTAIAEDLGGACGQNPPHVELRTRPRIGSAEFGFDIQASAGDIAFFCFSEATGALPLNNCTVLLAGSINPMFALPDAAGRATQPIPIPAVMALRGQDFFVHGSSWDVTKPLTELRLANAWRFLLGD